MRLPSFPPSLKEWLPMKGKPPLPRWLLVSMKVPFHAIERGVRYPVWKLNIEGFPTTNSCEGHPPEREAKSFIWFGSDRKGYERLKGFAEKYFKLVREEERGPYPLTTGGRYLSKLLYYSRAEENCEVHLILTRQIEPEENYFHFLFLECPLPMEKEEWDRFRDKIYTKIVKQIQEYKT